jgi:hypothetical protein
LVAAILNLIIPEDAPDREDNIEASPSFHDSQLETGVASLPKDGGEKGRDIDADADYKARVEPAPESSRT